MPVTIALAGDTMLGRRVADALADGSPTELVAPEIARVTQHADLFVLNLECCISERGAPWPDPGKPFYFRAPPAAIGLLRHLGVSCVTLANNHALDFGAEALIDTLGYLSEAGIATVGAGADAAQARRPAVLEAGGFRIAVIGVTDHPVDFAAGPSAPGVAFAGLRDAVPDWLIDMIAGTDADAVIVTPHWGPNMVAEPAAHVRAAAEAFIDAGATIVAGHSAHVFHGVSAIRSDSRRAVLYDLGDFLDDYAVDPVLRNDLGLLFLVTVDERGLSRIEVLPLKLGYCATAMATGKDDAWVRRRFREACAPFDTPVRDDGARLIIEP